MSILEDYFSFALSGDLVVLFKLQAIEEIFGFLQSQRQIVSQEHDQTESSINNSFFQ